MAELITEEQPRIKYTLHRAGHFVLQEWTLQLQQLADLMHHMERLGAAPVLNDGKVGGNCGISLDYAISRPTEMQGTSSERQEDISNAAPQNSILVSKSGKEPHSRLELADFVKVSDFSVTEWSVQFESCSNDTRPSSDTPLLHACLARPSKYGWRRQPRVAIHGHALAVDEGLAKAAALGIPISEHATLFSTPEDLHELEQLFMQHPYPGDANIYVRKGHGFFIVGETVAEVQQTFKQFVEPLLLHGVA